MSVSNYCSIEKPVPHQISRATDSKPRIRLRVKLFIPQQSQQTPILDRLMSDCGLSVYLFHTVLETDNRAKQLDLELHGTIAQINSGLDYLEALDVVIKGKPNPDGDSWDY